MNKMKKTLSVVLLAIFALSFMNAFAFAEGETHTIDMDKFTITYKGAAGAEIKDIGANSHFAIPEGRVYLVSLPFGATIESFSTTESPCYFNAKRASSDEVEVLLEEENYFVNEQFLEEVHINYKLMITNSLRLDTPLPVEDVKGVVVKILNWDTNFTATIFIQIPTALPRAQLNVGTVSGKPGESVSVPVTIKGNTGFAAFEAGMVYDETALTFEGYSVDGAILSDAIYKDKIVVARATDDYVDDGLLFTAKFKINEDAAPGEQDVSVKIYDWYVAEADTDYRYKQNPGKIIIEGETPAPNPGYQVSVPKTLETEYGGTVTVPVTLASSDAELTDYTNYTLQFSFDKSILSFDESACTGLSESADVAIEDNVVTIRDYGASKPLGEMVSLAFKGIDVGEGAVTLLSAGIGNGGTASHADELAATLENATATVTVTGYKVDLSDDFNGATAVKPNTDYQFEAKDKHYDYEITAKIGDQVVPVVDNGDGTYTIKAENITGNLVITDTKTPKHFTVTVSGNAAEDVTAAAEAVYLTDYAFTLTRDEQYNYDVTAAIGQTAVTLTPAEEGAVTTYQIAGADIVGDIVITAQKTLKPPTVTTITFVGEGAGDVEGGTSQTADIGSAFTFTLNPVEGFRYAVTAKRGETEVAITDNGDHTYTIAAADVTAEPITVTVTKTPEVPLEVTVNEYVKLNGKSVFLVKAVGTLSPNKVWGYDGNAMYISEKYDDAYCYLVISSGTLDEVKAEAKSKVAQVSATAVPVVYDFDVNETARVDTNDAQFVYNMYNAKYEEFDATVTMLKFLKADTNGDGVLSVLDSAAVIDHIKTA